MAVGRSASFLWLFYTYFLAVDFLRRGVSSPVLFRQILPRTHARAAPGCRSHRKLGRGGVRESGKKKKGKRKRRKGIESPLNGGRVLLGCWEKASAAGVAKFKARPSFSVPIPSLHSKPANPCESLKSDVGAQGPLSPLRIYPQKFNPKSPKSRIPGSFCTPRYCAGCSCRLDSPLAAGKQATGDRRFHWGAF